jgi:hypothetical protein
MRGDKHEVETRSDVDPTVARSRVSQTFHSRWPAACSVLAAVAVTIGVLGPWAVNPLFTLGGSLWIGLPMVVIVAISILGRCVTIARPRKLWYAAALLVDLFIAIVAVVLLSLIGTASQYSGPAGTLLGQATHNTAFGPDASISVGWGLPCVLIAALAGLLFSTIGFVSARRTLYLSPQIGRSAEQLKSVSGRLTHFGRSR